MTLPWLLGLIRATLLGVGVQNYGWELSRCRYFCSGRTAFGKLWNHLTNESECTTYNLNSASFLRGWDARRCPKFCLPLYFGSVEKVVTLWASQNNWAGSKKLISGCKRTRLWLVLAMSCANGNVIVGENWGWCMFSHFHSFVSTLWKFCILSLKPEQIPNSLRFDWIC